MRFATREKDDETDRAADSLGDCANHAGSTRPPVARRRTAASANGDIPGRKIYNDVFRDLRRTLRLNMPGSLP
jgi:hypothetical protein